MNDLLAGLAIGALSIYSIFMTIGFFIWLEVSSGYEKEINELKQQLEQKK